MPTRIAWILRDYSAGATPTPEEYRWQVNPAEFSIPYQKTISYQSTAAPDGNAVIYEGRDPVQRMTYSGTVLTQEQYEDLVYWFSKRHQLELTDDLGRTFWVYIVSFSPSRKRSNTYPWKHTYNGEMAILDWA